MDRGTEVTPGPDNAAFDPGAYFQRIGYTGSTAPTLETLHAITRHHAQSIPFENLDVLLGRPIAIDPASLMRKLVHARRGGYCFEQNSLLLLALQACGFRLTPLGARVRGTLPRDQIPARTHLFLQVHLPGGDWLTDVGMGSASLTCAIPFEFDRELPTPHETRRLERVGPRLFHQMWNGAQWMDVCEFTTEELHPIDREVGNWYTSANPASHFRKNLIVGRAAPEGLRHGIRDGEYTVRRRGEIISRQPIDSAATLHRILGEVFDLEFPASTRFGPPGAPWAV